MQTSMSPGALGRWTRRAWALPLVISLFGCGGGGSSDSTPAPAQPTSIPEDLRGQWETVLAYVPPFYSGPFGGTPQGDGSLGIIFNFSAEGHYQHSWSLAQAYFGGNCFRTAQWNEAGTLSIAGSEYTFNPGKATYAAMDSCGQSQYVDPAPVAPADHTLTLDRDPAGWPLLRMSFPDGELVLEKCRQC
jgi:hypothetical protein